MLSANTFILLILVPAALLASLFVIWPLLRRQDAPAPSGDATDPAAELNREIILERRQRLEAELASLPEGAPEREALIHEFSAAALADLQQSPDTASAAAPQARAPRRLLAAVVLVGLVALPIAFYRTTGMPEAVSPDFAAKASQPDVESLLATLETRLEAEPDRADGWLMLGRSRLSLGQLDQAVAALERGLAVDSSEPELAAQIRADLADALGQQAGNSLAGRPWALVQQALERQPGHPKAMAMAGAYQMSQQNYKAALDYWEPLLGQLDPGSAPYQQILQHIAGARQQAGLPPLPAASAANARGAPGTPAPAPAPAASPAAAAGPVLNGEVRLAPALASRVEAGDTVFLAVRGVDESGQPAGPPVAVQRLQAGALPHRFSFSDQDAMGPMGRLSGQTRVVVIARVAKQGTPAPQPGDLEGRSEVLPHDAQSALVVIDTPL